MKYLIAFLLLVGVAFSLMSLPTTARNHEHTSVLNAEFDNIYYHISQLLNPTVIARAYLSADQDNLTNGTWTRVLLNAETFDVGDNFSIANSSFTVPITGYYQINASVFFEAADLVADKHYYAQVRRDTSPIFNVYSHAAISQPLVLNGSDIFYLTAGQEVSLWAMSNSGDNAVDIDSGETETFLTIQLVR